MKLTNQQPAQRTPAYADAQVFRTVTSSWVFGDASVRPIGLERGDAAP